MIWGLTAGGGSPRLATCRARRASPTIPMGTSSPRPRPSGASLWGTRPSPSISLTTAPTGSPARLTPRTAPSPPEVVTSTYNDTGQLTGVSSSSPYVTAVRYDLFGRPTQITYGNGVVNRKNWATSASRRSRPSRGRHLPGPLLRGLRRRGERHPCGKKGDVLFYFSNLKFFR